MGARAVVSSCCFLLSLASVGAQDFLVHRQLPDGSWSARTPEGARDSIAALDEVAERRLRVTALSVIALRADGSTSRRGPQRDAQRKALFWMLGQQDEQGRFALDDSPGWVLDHALATAAFVDLARDRVGERLDGAAARAMRHLDRHLRLVRRVECELLAWSSLAVAAGRTSPPGTGRAEAAAALENSIARWFPSIEVVSPRDHAACLLLAALGGGTPPFQGQRDRALRAALLRAEASAVLRSLPDLTVDPVASWMLGLALRCSIGEEFKDQDWIDYSIRVKQDLVARQHARRAPPFEFESYTWDARGEIEVALGRSGTLATHFAILCLYYRMGGLAVLGD